MKKYAQQSLLASLVLAAGIHQAMADAPTQINITGNVVASPCTVDTANSNLNVNLGNIQATDLATSGATSGYVDFFLTLKDCPATTRYATASFAGTTGTGGTDYKNTGTATNLNVQLKESKSQQDGVMLPPGASLTRNIAADHTASFKIGARAIATGNNVMPGTIIAISQVTFTYQ